MRVINSTFSQARTGAAEGSRSFCRALLMVSLRRQLKYCWAFVVANVCKHVSLSPSPRSLPAACLPACLLSCLLLRQRSVSINPFKIAHRRPRVRIRVRVRVSSVSSVCHSGQWELWLLSARIYRE